MLNLRGNQNNQIILKKKNKVTKLTLPDLKTYCKATVIRQCGPGIGWTIEQYGRTESRNNPRTYSQRVFKRTQSFS